MAAASVSRLPLLLVLFLGAPWKRILCAAQPPPPPQDAEFTFLLPAGRRECFYQAAPGNGSMEVEYQVIGGAGLDVDFSLESPSGMLLVNEYRRSDGLHTYNTITEGWGRESKMQLISPTLYPCQNCCNSLTSPCCRRRRHHWLLRPHTPYLCPEPTLPRTAVAICML